MRILIISEYIAPLQAIASIRWTKIAKYLKRLHPDIHITVLTNEKRLDECVGIPNKDDLLAGDMECFDEYLQFPRDKALDIYESLKEREKCAVASIQSDMLRTGEQSSLWSQCKKEILLTIRDIKDKIYYCQAMRFLSNHETPTFDIIISTYGPAWPHLVAEQIKRSLPKAFWLVDFRDPYAKETDGPISFLRHKHFTRKHCAQANMITRVTDKLYVVPPAGIPVETVSNGFDLDEALLPAHPTVFSLVYTGVLYGEHSDIGIACKVLKELCQEGAVEHAFVSYAGPSADTAQMLAKQYGAEQYLKSLGMLPRREALKLQQQAAVLLQLDWNSAMQQCEWSGKMYEYMMMRKPIVFIVTGPKPYSYPRCHIAELGDCCYEESDAITTYPQMKQYILDKYQEWQRTGNTTIMRNEEYVKRYSYQYITEQLWEKINLIQNKGEQNEPDEARAT